MALPDEKLGVEQHERPSVDGPMKPGDFGLAKQAAEEEHNLSILEAARQNPKAVLWSVLLSTCIM